MKLWCTVRNRGSMNLVYRVIYTFSAGKRTILCSMILGGVVLGMAVGCDRDARYKILTFFFEGVPPLDSDSSAAKIKITKTITKKTGAEYQTETVVKERLTRLSKQKRASKHKEVRDCSGCHVGKFGSGRRALIKALPDLCYSCHTNYHDAGGYLHAPVRVGDCVVCHDAHQSMYVHLQKAALPQLCLQCHLPEDMKTIEDHEDKLESICTDCHDPHTSSMRKLLKPPEQLENDPNIVNLSK